MRFPTHDPSATSPRAAIKIVGASGGTDELNPGTGKFSFGADVWLDSGSTSSSEPGSKDNGDNVIQRGLYDGVSQYKLQVDNRRPMCRIKGDAGAVEVTSELIDPEVWYRLLCTRDGDVVTLEVTTWDESNQPTTVTTSATGSTGDMTPGTDTVPLSVGGKLLDSGSVAGSADQLNGRIDNPHLSIEP
ncbi:MAG: hypothetical protein KDB02_02640 [Acidimicrobiales bacterium]|nr:hypothetical protein [Acidimicrobiales bacterium]MCB1247331.1 hypothetical protein [Acidimicrobiia bacterium]